MDDKVKELVEKLEKIAEGLLELIDDLTTDQWGGAGPDCCTMPVKAGSQ